MLPLGQQNTMGIVAKTAADVPLIKKVPRNNFFPPRAGLKALTFSLISPVF